jgi:hypothetical protein
MAKTLRLHFGTPSGTDWTLSVRYPKETITLAEATAAANAIIGAGVFLKNPNSFQGADIVDRTVTEIE